MSAKDDQRVVVVVGLSTPEIDATLATLGLVPFCDAGGKATVWLRAEKEIRSLLPPPPMPESTSTSGPLLLTIAQVATALGVDRSTVYELIARGQLEIVHLGRAARIPSSAVSELVRGLREAGQQQASWSVHSAKLRLAGLVGVSQR